MQALLEERFRLKIHWETRDTPAYELTVAGGPKLQPSHDGSCITFSEMRKLTNNAPWEYRGLPDRNVSSVVASARERADTQILPKYRAHATEARIETRVHASYPGLVLDPESPAVAFVREVSGGNAVETVAYGTEAGLFQRAGIPAVVCGPGSIEQAHKADEFLALSELAACEAFLRKVIARVSA